MFDRKGTLTLKGFTGSGADWLERYKPFIEDGKTVVVSPHKIYGPESNDLALQLRKRGIDKVILAGMSANLCTESHMRELIEQGFEVAVVSDATAAAVLPGLDGYKAALVNFRMIASHVWKTAEAVKAMTGVAVRGAHGAATPAHRSFEEKVRALALFEKEGLTRTEAMIKAAEEFETPITKSMNDNPNGAFRLYVQSVRKALESGNEEVEKLVVKAGLGTEQKKPATRSKKRA